MTGQLPVVLEFVATADRLAGRLARSQAVSEEGLALAREAGYENTVAAHLANLAVLAALRGEEEPCERQARGALAIALPHRVGLCAGVAAYALAMLELCLGRYASAHDRFRAIAVAGPGAGHPTVAWRTMPDQVEAAVGAGDETGSAPPPSVLDALTPQELRIAGLVADGLSSKQIAAQLFLSPRTVEYHLYKIYPKLGIGSRTDLARLVVLQKAPVAADDML